MEKKLYGVRLPKELSEVVNREAEKQEITGAEVIRKAVEFYFDHQNREAELAIIFSDLSFLRGILFAYLSQQVDPEKMKSIREAVEKRTMERVTELLNSIRKRE